MVFLDFKEMDIAVKFHLRRSEGMRLWKRVGGPRKQMFNCRPSGENERRQKQLSELWS